jgi:hypothetical protein
MDSWEILLPFDTFCVDLAHFSGFGFTHKEKSGNPDPRRKKVYISANQKILERRD